MKRGLKAATKLGRIITPVMALVIIRKISNCAIRRWKSTGENIQTAKPPTMTNRVFRTAAPVVLIVDKGAKAGTYTVTLRGSLKFNGKPLTADKTLQVVIEAPAGQ